MTSSILVKVRRVADGMMERGRAVDPKFAFRVSAACLTLALTIALSTLLPGAPYFPEAAVFVLFGASILLHFRTVSLLTPLHPGRQFGLGWLREVTRPLPRYTGFIFAGLFLIAWVTILVTMVRHTRGAPTELNGHFYLNNHGSLTRVSHSEYVAELLRWERVFSLGAACFLGAGFVVNWAALRDPQTFSPQLDHPG
jgi:hypothetical protein